MNGIVTRYDSKDGVACVDSVDSSFPLQCSVPIRVRKNALPLVGRMIRFNPTEPCKGIFIGYVELKKSSRCAEDVGQVYRGVVSSVTQRFLIVECSALDQYVTIPRTQLADLTSNIGEDIAVSVSNVVEFTLESQSFVVKQLLSLRRDTNAAAELVIPQPVAATGKCDPEAPVVGSFRGAAAKLNQQPNIENNSNSTVKQENAIEFVSSDVAKTFLRQKVSHSGESLGAQAAEGLGTWTSTGFDPSFFFPPELTIKFTYNGVELTNTTPPMLCQGDVVGVELWSFWVLDGASMDLHVVDEEEKDVTSVVAAVSVVVPDCDVMSMDAPSPQQVCCFEVKILPFEMEEACEIFFEVRAMKRGLRVRNNVVDEEETHVGPTPTQLGAAPQGDCCESQQVGTRVRSRGIFIRCKEIARGAPVLDKDSHSHVFWVNNVLSPNDKIDHGFVDPGRSNTLLQSITTYEEMQLAYSEREIIVIEKDDKALSSILQAASEVVEKIFDTRARANALLWFVALSMKDGMFSKPAESRAATVEGEGSSRALQTKKRQGIDSRKRKRELYTPQPAVLRLGEVTDGLCRHRSLLFKYLCDNLRVPCYIVRGEHRSSKDDVAERHSWNVIATSHDALFIVDAMLSPEKLLPWPDDRYIGPDLPLFSPTSLLVTHLSPSLKPTILEECGRGACASVRKCTIGGLICACKIPRTEQDRDSLLVEYKTLKLFQGVPAIVQCYGWYKGILLEFYPHSLLAFINMLIVRRSKMSWKQAKQVVTGVLSALVAVHQKKLVHRDVKAENVLLNVHHCGVCLQFGTVCRDCDVCVALADFADCYDAGRHGAGLDVVCPAGARGGTAVYAAPEIEHELPFSYACDMWSVAVLTAEVCQMQLPSSATCPEGRERLLPHGSGSHAVFVPKLRSHEAPPWAHELMDKCFQLDWRKRLTAKEALMLVVAAPDCEAPVNRKP